MFCRSLLPTCTSWIRTCGQSLRIRAFHWLNCALELDRAIGNLSGDRPAVVPVETFVPPAVEDAEINSAVRRAFHSTGAARFHRSQRIVQPKIDTLHQAAGDVAVVILKEHNAIFESGFSAESINFMDESATAFIAGMRFARKNKLDRPGGVVEQSLQSLFVAKQKRAAFVGREPPRKTDG